jgi:aminocyclopropanecarboxylate oxidase
VRAGSELLDKYIAQTVPLAELLAECMSRNLGLASGHIKSTFSLASVLTQVRHVPGVPPPGELLWGLRAHTDAGGVIVMLQDEAVGRARLPQGRQRVGPVNTKIW